MSKETNMILTDKKSIIDLIGQDIVAEIADDHVHGTEEFNSDFPAVNRLKEAWWEEAENEANDLDGWEYDRETGEYNERGYI